MYICSARQFWNPSKVRIPKMADRVRILPLRCSIQELSVHKVEFASGNRDRVRIVYL